MADTTAPAERAALQLPPASVDFNALNDALAAGKSNEDAIAAAVVEETVALSPDEAAARAAASQAELPNVRSLNKAGLTAAAAAEGVAYARAADGSVIAIADATNGQMADAIEAKRNGAPILPVEAPAPAADAE